MNKKKVLLIGASSQIGSSLLAEDQSSINFIEASRSDIDLTRLDQIEQFIKNNDPDIVINCAAFTNVDLAEEEPSLAATLNELSVREIVKGCNSTKATLIHFSTDYVFNGESSEPYSESSSTNPLSIYGKTKLSGDLSIVRESNNFLIFRISWIYGNHGSNFLKAIVKKIRSKEEFKVVADQIGSPTSSKFVAQVLIHLISKFELAEFKEILNLQPRGSVSWFEFANFINNNIKPSDKLSKKFISAVSSEDYNARAKRPKYSVLSTKKIEKLFDLKFLPWQDYAVQEINDMEK